jgi:hypothetical protein
MGRSCQTFREEPVTRACVGWRGPSMSAFLTGSQTPPEFTSLCTLGRGSCEYRRGLGTFAFTRALHPQGRLINPKGGKR